jgi:hypothetical protein
VCIWISLSPKLGTECNTVIGSSPQGGKLRRWLPEHP